MLHDLPSHIVNEFLITLTLCFSIIYLSEHRYRIVFSLSALVVVFVTL